MSKTRAEMRSEVSENFGRSVSDSKLDDVLDDMVKRIGRRHEWKDLLSFTNNLSITGASEPTLAYVTLPDYHRLKGLWIIGSTELIPVSIRTKWWCEYAFRRGRRAGYFGYEEDDKFYFLPEPIQSEAKARIYSLPTLGSGDSATVSLTGVDDVVIALATSQIFRKHERFESAKDWESDGYIKLREAVDDDRKKIKEEHDLTITGASSRLTMNDLLQGVPTELTQNG